MILPTCNVVKVFMNINNLHSMSSKTFMRCLASYIRSEKKGLRCRVSYRKYLRFVLFFWLRLIFILSALILIPCSVSLWYSCEHSASRRWISDLTAQSVSSICSYECYFLSITVCLPFEPSDLRSDGPCVVILFVSMHVAFYYLS